MGKKTAIARTYLIMSLSPTLNVLVTEMPVCTGGGKLDDEAATVPSFAAFKFSSLSLSIATSYVEKRS